MKHILFILTCAAIWSSCSDDFFSQTVEIDPPAYEKQISFHIRATTADSSLRVILSRNYGILEEVVKWDDWYVRGAQVTLYENGQSWLSLHPLNQDSNFILTGILPSPFKAGAKYEIRVQHSDFTEVYAQQIVPNDFQVDSVRVRYDATPSEFGGKSNLLEVFLQDNPNEKNYYEVGLYGRQYLTEYNPVTQSFDTVDLQEFPIYIDGYNDPNVLQGVENGGLISDQFFNGQSYKFQARFFGSPGSTVDSTFIVRVRNVTEDYFKWSRSYQQKYDDDENPLVEPISVFDNLENGLGIFSVSNQKRFLRR